MPVKGNANFKRSRTTTELQYTSLYKINLSNAKSKAINISYLVKLSSTKQHSGFTKTLSLSISSPLSLFVSTCLCLSLLLRFLCLVTLFDLSI